MDWRNQVAILAKYQAYKDKFTSIMLVNLECMMYSKFRSVWGGHLRRIDILNYRIELLSPDTAPVRSAPYRTGLKTREFEKAVTEKMLTENIIEPTQTGGTAPLVLALKKNRTLSF